RTTAWQERILAALRTYQKINRNTLAPYSFIVPTGDARWPRATWGYALGRAVSGLRGQAQKQALSARMETELKELNFAFNILQYQWDEIILPALRHFYTVNGHTDVPRAFVVPGGVDAWPRLSWGWKLGSTVTLIRNMGGYARQVEESKHELKEMKFCFEMVMAEREWNEKVLPALKVFRQVHHHCIVERLFKVPREFPWPEEAWDLPLGQVVNDMRMGKTYVEFVARDADTLNEIGFAWDRNASTWNDRIIPALQTYVAEFKTCRMPQSFVVPAREPWPKSAWNMALGRQVYYMKYEGSYFLQIGRDVERLSTLGFCFELRHQAWEKRVEPLLEIYESCFGDRAVPHDFVIPSEAPWPENMWGVHLGFFVRAQETATEGEL
ncbi:hypothetical protein PHYSODRAFT_528496, partial [Phytophthora sojae]